MRRAIIVLTGLAVTMAALAGPAKAAEDRNWGLTLRAGVASNFGMTDQEGWSRTPEDTRQYDTLTMHPFDFTDGATVGLALKYRLYKNLWLEGDYRWRRIGNTARSVWSRPWGGRELLFHDVTIDSRIHASSLMASLLYEFPVGLPVKPYVRGGLGIGGHVISSDTVRSRRPNVRHSDLRLRGNTAVEIHPAWSVGAGLNYPITERFSLNIDAQYIDLGKLDADIHSKVDHLAYIHSLHHAPETDLRFFDVTVGLTFLF